jgi:hypothetical protein
MQRLPEQRSEQQVVELTIGIGICHSINKPNHVFDVAPAVLDVQLTGEAPSVPPDLQQHVLGLSPEGE